MHREPAVIYEFGLKGVCSCGECEGRMAWSQKSGPKIPPRRRDLRNKEYDVNMICGFDHEE
jgi:hypothetical protein